VTTILVTHDQEEALSMADRIVVMNQGRIEQVGTPREVYETPATPFAADFIGKVNVLPGIAVAGGRVRVGGAALAVGRSDLVTGAPARIYLRPEDVNVHVDGSLPAGAPNALPASVTKVEFLGAFCLVGIALAASGTPPLVANVPRQAVDAGGLDPGAAVTVSIAPSALRVLG
jgi:iron(III) transport system ATP-binding protein